MLSWVVYCAVAILVILAVIACVMWLKVLKLQRQRREALIEMERTGNAKIAEHRLKQNKDIQVVANAALNDELTLTETSLRLCYLLEQFGVGADSHPEYRSIFLLKEKTQHIPILAAWRALSVQDQRQFDKDRLIAEAELADDVTAALKLIKGRSF